MTDRPDARVAALVPAWNAEGFIDETLASLAAQRWPNFRIIISDDASTDATAARCEAWVRRDARFSLIRQPRNLGWIGNSNALLDAADADYLLFAFHDDQLEPDCIATLAGLLEQSPDAAMAYGDVTTIRPWAGEAVETSVLVAQAPNRAMRLLAIAGTRQHWWAPFRGLARADAARRAGGLMRHARGEVLSDWAFLVGMAAQGRFVREPRVLVRKYFKNESLSLTWKLSVPNWWAASRLAARQARHAGLGPFDLLCLEAGLAQTLLGKVARRATRRLLWKRGPRARVSSPAGSSA